MIYGLESAALTNRQEAELDVGDMKILRFSLGVTWMDGIRNKFIRRTGHAEGLEKKVGVVRLRWFEPVQKRNREYTGC